MSEISPEQTRFAKMLVTLLPKESDYDRDIPDTKVEASIWIDGALEIALPMARQWARLFLIADDYGVAIIRDSAFRNSLTFAKATKILDTMNRKPATEAMLTRLADIEDRAYDKHGTLAGVNAGQCYDREWDAKVRLDEREVEEMLGLGIDPGADALQHATEGTADEVEPVTEGSSVNRRKRG